MLRCEELKKNHYSLNFVRVFSLTENDYAHEQTKHDTMHRSTPANLLMIITRRSHFLVILCLTMYTIDVCNGHGRLIEPPSRSSAFRYGFQTPPNYNDHELYCGGFARQQRNGGKCGECGDAWDLPQPRPNEYGGKYGQGVIVRTYKPGSDITLRVELTASHMGFVDLCTTLRN